MATDTPDVKKWTTERLEKRAAELAEKRTEIRLEQNAISDELSIRKALEQLPESARREIYLRLEGKIAMDGGLKEDDQ